MNLFDIGPMVGGIGADLGQFRDDKGAKYVALLQYGGKVPPVGSSSTKVGNKWVKNAPSAPTTAPVVTVMLAAGGPRDTFDAAMIVDCARCGASFTIASLWPDTDPVEFPPKEIERLGAHIEQAIPGAVGMFTTCWVSPADQPDYLPF